jgi:aconitate decarboxylase
MAHAPGISTTRAFTELVSSWPADDPELLDRCRLLLLDGIAVAVAGAKEPGPRLLAEHTRAECPEGPATMIGQGSTTNVVGATRVNGVAMHVLDFEPMWNPANHALSPIVPALLALAEKRERDGAASQGYDVLRALAKGVEAQGRLRLASGQMEPAKLSMHPPGAVGAPAAALACGCLLDLDVDQLTAAVGIAGSRTGGLLANVGSMTKALHCGDAAANGVQAAMLASRGFSSNDDALAGPRGWGPSLFGPSFDPQFLLAPVGKGRALDPGPSWKLFPSQFATHFGITAALEAREAIGSDLSTGIAQVRLRAPSMPYINRPHPQSGLDGKFSWQYTVAIALLDGKVEPASFADARRFSPDVVALLERTTVIDDADIPGRFDQMHVEIEVTLNNGAVVRKRCDSPLGSWSRPVPKETVMKKIRSLLTDVLGAAKADAIEHAITTDFRFAIRPLMKLLA